MAPKSHQMILVENDTKNLQLNFDGDYTGCVVTMHIKYPDGVTIVNCPAVDDAIGLFTTAFTEGDLVATPKVNYKIRVVFPSGEIETHNRVDEDGEKGKLLELIIDGR